MIGIRFSPGTKNPHSAGLGMIGDGGFPLSKKIPLNGGLMGLTAGSLRVDDEPRFGSLGSHIFGNGLTGFEL
ncbi:hypothetical protein, partial [Pseudomonas sp. Fl4BN1]|uniref:hypothetical protein n=1 Tax=Pseudomonas sp. Fl4BN1 TaxID=2697651 RepID=UPI001C49AA39